jgi:hypothetical protein
MKKNLLLSFFCLLTVLSFANNDNSSYFGGSNSEAPTDITFCLDLTNCPVGPAAAALVGDFNGFSNGSDFLTGTAIPNVFCKTVGLEAGDYVFQFFTANGQFENLSAEPCAVMYNGVTGAAPNSFRPITVVEGTQQTVTYGWNTCDPACPEIITSDVTFCVDLSCFEVADAVALVGTFNNWDPGANFMTQMGGNLFCTTVAMPLGDQEFKYFFAQGGWEELTPGDPCTVTDGPFTNRVINVVEGGEQSVTYGWGTCEETCPDGPTLTDINFCVDLSCFPVADAVALGGAFNNWNPGIDFMTNTGNGIYCITVGMEAGPQEFKFFFAQEQYEDFAEGDPCTVTSFGFTNRVITVVEGMPETYSYGWESCDDTCTPPPGANITFCVDVECLDNIDYVNIFGAFNGWNGGGNSLYYTEDGGIWCTTIFMQPGQQEYKFLANGTEESFTPGAPCTVSCCGNAFTNRVLTVVNGMDQTVLYGFESCDETCYEVPTPEEAAPSPDPCKRVISMFSNAYDDVPVTTWLTGWSPGAVLTDLQIEGNDTKKYENVAFLGIETTGANLIDASSMTHFNIDVWTPNMTVFRVKLVDFGADGAYSPWADDSEWELSFVPVQEGWNTYKIPMADFVGLASTEHIAQLILSGDPWGSGVFYMDNVYFSNDIPVISASINQSGLPEWCQGVKTLYAKVNNDAVGPLTFSWDNDLGNTQEVVALANGVYTVIVTDADGCTAEASTLVDEDLSALLSAQTIIAGEELELSMSSVMSGGVGVLDAEEVSVQNNSYIATILRSAGAFIDGSSSVEDYMDSDSPLTLPEFLSNPYNDNNDVSVPSGGSMTLSGSNYGDVKVGKNATLIIDNGTIFLKSLTVNTASTIIFNQPTNMMVKKKVRIGMLCNVNVEGPTIVIYSGDNASVGQGSTVQANIYAPEGLEVNDNGAYFMTYMIGMFISNDGVASNDNVVWNWNPNCNDMNEEEEIEFNLPFEAQVVETLNQKSELINIFPNPVSDLLNVDLNLDTEREVIIEILDVTGRTFYSQKHMFNGTTIQIDLNQANMPTGLYMLNVPGIETPLSTRFIKE